MKAGYRMGSGVLSETLAAETTMMVRPEQDHPRLGKGHAAICFVNDRLQHLARRSRCTGDFALQPSLGPGEVGLL